MMKACESWKMKWNKCNKPNEELLWGGIELHAYSSGARYPMKRSVSLTYVARYEWIHGVQTRITYRFTAKRIKTFWKRENLSSSSMFITFIFIKNKSSQKFMNLISIEPAFIIDH
jgi:hypothetical protein